MGLPIHLSYFLFRVYIYMYQYSKDKNNTHYQHKIDTMKRIYLDAAVEEEGFCMFYLVNRLVLMRR